jgi:putative aldouronate transport system substrate-binding protein
MLKRKKSFILALLLASIIASSLAGCNSKKSTSSGGDNNQVADKPSKLHALGRGRTNKFIKFDEREQYPVWKEVQKLLNEAKVELEYEIVPFEQYEVVIKTRMASGSNLPDIANVSNLDNTTVLNLAKQGVIIELNSLIDKYDNGNIKKTYNTVFPFAKQATTSPDGKMYWFSNLHKKMYKDKDPAPVALTSLIRKDWLEKLNIPVPTNAEEYLNALKTMRAKDANGNGQQDEVLIYNPGGFGGSIAQWFGLGTGITAVDVENKKVVSPWYQEGIKEYFKYLQRLVKEGVLDTSLIGAGYEQTQQKITENKAAAMEGYNLGMYEQTIKAQGASLLPMMPLKAVNGITPAAQLEPPFLVWEKYVITKACKDPAAAIRFFDVIYSEKYAELSYWGIVGDTFKKDADGAKLFINNGPEEELAKARKSAGNAIYGDTIFPRVQYANLEFELARVEKHKAEQQLKVMNYKPYFVNMNNVYLAIPDDKQLEEKTKILNNLNTYSSELATKLALGQKSLDDWDQYIAELKKLGLDKLIEIDQKLHDRYNSLR